MDKTNKTNDTINTNMKLSLQTKQFVKEMKSIDIDESNISDEIISKYGIVTRNNQYFITGLAKVNERFDLQELKNMNININSKSGNIITLEIPLNDLDIFLKYKGVNYFEISQKVELKK